MSINTNSRIIKKAINMRPRHGALDGRIGASNSSTLENVPSNISHPLKHYRVLELPGIAPLFVGKVLADLGADIIKVEPLSGDPADAIYPALDPSSVGVPRLVWSTYSAGKRRVRLDLASARGLDTIKRLIADTDVLVEGFSAAELDHLALGHNVLRNLNPALVIASVTPFGQEGPYASWKGSDLIHFAMSGYLNLTGSKHGPPVKPTAPLQTYLHASLHTAAGILLALQYRNRTGKGTHIDQSIREVGIWMLANAYQFSDLLHVSLQRLGDARDLGGLRSFRSLYACKDGQVVWWVATGQIGAVSMQALVDWMDTDDMAPEWLRNTDWRNTNHLQMETSQIQRLEQVFASFFARKTKHELLDWALMHGLMLAPVNTLPDVLADPHLIARDIWRLSRLEGVSELVRLPAQPLRISGMRWEPRVLHDSSPANTATEWRSRPKLRSQHEINLDGRLPLAGLRVIDLSTTLAGPCTARHLADFGAEVIKVESRSHPETLRTTPPFAEAKPGVNRSGYFAAYNAGKKSLAINLQKPAALHLLRRLIEKSDILVESFAPGVMARWGLTWEKMHEWNPRLIVASHSLQGQWGPWSRQRGYGQVVTAMSGFYSLTGLAAADPVGPYAAYTDFISWPFLLTAVLTALEVRSQTGLGQHIDQGQFETSVQFLTPLLAALQATGTPATRNGNREEYAAPNNVYPCLGDDRWLAVTITSDQEWSDFCSCLGKRDAARDSRFVTHTARKANEDALDELVASWTKDAAVFHLARSLQSAGIPAAPVLAMPDLSTDPQLLHRGFFRRLVHPEIGNHSVPMQTFKIEGVESGPFSPAPLLGEHSAQICRDVLCLSDEEIESYTAQGVFE